MPTGQPQDTPESVPVRTKVFISYSHSDRKYLDRLLVHLSPLVETGQADVWADTRLQPGTAWLKEICNALAETKVAILLVSIDFLASRFIANEELPPLLKAAEQEGVLILPVIVGQCRERFLRTPSLAQYQAINDPAQPLSKLKGEQRDFVWDRLIARVEDYLYGSG
ncbi:MAG: toll/interleukin-1 receptor domain-containing protein [Isosphaeraceae bacterium]